ncbi:haloacid dehalogenase-like hydrolase [Serratia marcescens]|uniref:Haloacid dehalogenase-like hydrolase n=1 Tax=Serratia marcescens TaxID=615 RepID=A0A939NP87_SERMA|nr:haloacid dehalogenase-like hydrolase [Serratia marcescens]
MDPAGWSASFAPAELELQEQQLMQLYYQGKLSMEDYMQATLAPLDRPERANRGRLGATLHSPRYPAARLPAAVNACSGTASAATASGDLRHRRLVAPIAEQLGADDALAIGVEISDGRFTGNTYGTMTYQQGKVIRLQHWLAQHPHLKFRTQPRPQRLPQR